MAARTFRLWPSFDGARLRSARLLVYRAPFPPLSSNGFTSEHHDLSHRLALAQPIEPHIDLVEPQPAAHQPIDRQFAAAIQLDVARQVARRYAGADVAALHSTLLGDEADLRQRKAMIGRRQARRHRGPSAASNLVCKVHRADRTGHLKSEFDAAVGRRAD